MKKLMMVALCALGANVSMAEWIYRVPIGDLYYTLDDETLTAEVVNPGAGVYSLTNVEIPECVIYEGESYAVTAIDSSAFSKYGSPLESVSAPFVTSIGSLAFSRCSLLESVYAPRVTSIERDAFDTCTSLASLTVHSSMKDGWDSNKGEYGINGNSVNPQVDFATVPKLTPQQVAQAKWEATITVSSPALKSRGETLDKAEYENACEFYGVEAKQEPTVEDYKFVPSGSVVVPEEQVIPEGYKAVPQNAQIVPTGYIAVKPEQVIPEGSVAVKPEQVIPEGSVAVKPEQVIPEGYKAVPQNAQIVQEGEKVVPKDAQVVQEGEKVVSKDAQVVQEDEIAVKKESIQAAKAETISIANNEIQLGVSVMSNSNITAEIADWGKVNLASENVKVENGNVVITIPVDSASGFMILQSKDAKVNNVPDKIIEDR